MLCPCLFRLPDSHATVFFTPFLRTGVYAGRKYVRSFVRSYVDLKAPFFAHIHVDKVSSPANFHPIVNVLDLYFKGQRFESNTLASSYVECARVFVGTIAKMSRGISLACLQRVAFSTIAFDGVYPLLCVCVCVLCLCA